MDLKRHAVENQWSILFSCLLSFQPLGLISILENLSVRIESGKRERDGKVMGLLITIQAALNSKIKRLPIISQMTIACAINLIPIFWTTLSGSRNKKNQSNYEIRTNRKVLRSQIHTRPDKMSIAGKILMESLFDQESKANKKNHQDVRNPLLVPWWQLSF